MHIIAHTYTQESTQAHTSVHMHMFMLTEAHAFTHMPDKQPLPFILSKGIQSTQ